MVYDKEKDNTGITMETTTEDHGFEIKNKEKEFLECKPETSIMDNGEMVKNTAQVDTPSLTVISTKASLLMETGSVKESTPGPMAAIIKDSGVGTK